ncbi:acyltransferase [Serratia fonticola]|uniref:Acyltransferase n=1 Tax=Serratia fonticola TaxID=47917 RepID=A0ABY9PSP0_SERFO|nr:acyltransferase [Serratia fonticola]WMT16480.1 acyltransferase [Serratia fonticola]
MKAQLQKIKVLCRKSECSFLYVLTKSLFYRIIGLRNFLSSNRVEMKGIRNIKLKNGTLIIGLKKVGHVSNKTSTYFNVRGELICSGSTSFGRGCRVDISEGAFFKVHGGYIGPENDFIIYNGIEIGSGCNISWGCQFMDDDFHSIEYENKRNKNRNIYIGDNVWIGCNSSILKGTYIAKGCVVAANAVVSDVFLEEGCLIGGNPARVIKRNVSWNL